MDRLLCLLIYLFVFLARFAKAFAKVGIGSYDAWEPGKKLDVLLVGYSGARNTGSDVRVATIAQQVSDLFGAENVHMSVLTLNAKSLEGYFDDNVTILEISSLFPVDLYRACVSHHAAVICEGSTMKSKFANGLTLFLGMAAGVMGAQKKPCIAYGSEVGDMEPFLAKAAKRLFKHTYIITRSAGSAEALKALGLAGHLGTDAAWLYRDAISAEEADSLLRQQGWDGKRPLLGVAVIDPFVWPVRASLCKWIRTWFTRDHTNQYDKWYFYSDSPARREIFGRYLAGIAEGVNRFLASHDFFPVIIGMEQLDEAPCRRIRDLLSRESALFLAGTTAANVMTGILHRLSAIVTSRYHASVLSMEAGCPIAAVSMDERLDNIMAEVGLADDFLFHVTDTDLGNTLAAALSTGCDRADAIRDVISTQLVAYKTAQGNMGTFLKHFIETGLGMVAAPSRA